MTTLKIGFIDSGVGGLSILNTLAHNLNAPEIYYLADAAHLPYGQKAPDFLYQRALAMSLFLQKEGITTIYVACHTLSATVLEKLGAAMPTITYKDLLVPTVEAAYKQSQNKMIGIMATPATIKTGIHKRLLHKKNDSLTIIEQACPDFVPLVEQCQPEPATSIATRYYLEPLQEANVDTVILGCTHYWFLQEKLQLIAPEITFISAANTVAPTLAGTTRPLIRLITTGSEEYVNQAAKQFCLHKDCCSITVTAVGDF